MIEHPATSLAASRALTRLELGTYGTCESCSVPIPLDEILATPHVERCAGCTTVVATFVSSARGD